MSIHSNLNVTYDECYSRLYLNESEWHEMINKFITSIQSKPFGKKL